MSFWEQLAQPYNLFYTVSIGLVAFFVALQVLGLGLDELLNLDIGVDADTNIDLDLDVSPDLDVDVDVAADVSADAPGGPGVDAADLSGIANDASGVSWLGAMMLFFHAQHLPAILVIYLLFTMFGFGGISITVLAREHLGWTTDMQLLGTLPIAFAFAILSTKIITWTLATFFPFAQPATARNKGLIGREARAISGGIDHRLGKAVVRNAQGHDMIVTCRMAPGEAPIATDGKVTLVSYDDDARLFLCRGVPVSADAS